MGDRNQTGGYEAVIRLLGQRDDGGDLYMTEEKTNPTAAIIHNDQQNVDFAKVALI